MGWVCFKVGNGTNDPPMPRFFRFEDVETILLGRAFGSGVQEGDVTVNLAVRVRLRSGLDFQIELKEGKSFLKSFQRFIKEKFNDLSDNVFFTEFRDREGKAGKVQPDLPDNR